MSGGPGRVPPRSSVPAPAPVEVVAGWRVERRHGPAAALHAGWPSVARDPTRRAVALCRPEGPAVVLGSRQPDTSVDATRCRARGMAVVRRRSGGGAVLVTPDDPLWVDVWVPSGDPLWCADVTVAFAWVGRWWGSALTTLGAKGVGIPGPGDRRCTRWSTSVCFGGVAAGELTTDDGRKVVGLAQRRTRDGAWFHTAAYRRWQPGALVDLLALGPEDRTLAVGELAGAATGIAELVGPRAAETLPDALLAALP